MWQQHILLGRKNLLTAALFIQSICLPTDVAVWHNQVVKNSLLPPTRPLLRSFLPSNHNPILTVLHLCYWKLHTYIYIHMIERERDQFSMYFADKIERIQEDLDWRISSIETWYTVSKHFDWSDYMGRGSSYFTWVCGQERIAGSVQPITSSLDSCPSWLIKASRWRLWDWDYCQLIVTIGTHAICFLFDQ